MHQPDQRSSGWLATIVEQRQELAELTSRGVLNNYAIEVLSTAYDLAIERAVAETGLAATVFPAQCPFTLDELLSPDLLAE
jgi:hypothetical protein